MIMFVCVATIMVNLTSIPWNKHDISTKDRAKKTCKVKYNDCLKRFTKKGEKAYWTWYLNTNGDLHTTVVLENELDEHLNLT